MLERDKESAITFCFPGTCYAITLMLNLAAHNSGRSKKYTSSHEGKKDLHHSISSLHSRFKRINGIACLNGLSTSQASRVEMSVPEKQLYMHGLVTQLNACSSFSLQERFSSVCLCAGIAGQSCGV